MVINKSANISKSLNKKKNIGKNSKNSNTKNNNKEINKKNKNNIDNDNNNNKTNKNTIKSKINNKKVINKINNKKVISNIIKKKTNKKYKLNKKYKNNNKLNDKTSLFNRIKSSNIYHKSEHFVDKLIPYLIVLLLFIIIGEFTMDLHPYEHEIHILDTFIILVFVMDLFFKYQTVPNNKVFVKKYWLDILAVFPFYLFFRIFSEAANMLHLGEMFAEGQILFHEGLELEKEGSRIAKEVEKLGRVEKEAAKAKFLPRILRAIQRSPRLFKAKVFFQWHKYKRNRKQ